MIANITALQQRYQPLIGLENEINAFRKTQSSMLNPIARQDISELWVNMTQAFGLRFTSNFGEQDNGVWYEALRDFTRLELAQGFKIMLREHKAHERQKKEVWPPNAKEFSLYCADAFKYYGIPSTREAYSECQRNGSYSWHDWSHPTVFYAMLYMADTEIPEDIFHKKLPVYRSYYLMMVALHVSGRLTKLPPADLCKKLLTEMRSH